MASLSPYAATAMLNGTAIPANLYMDLHIGDPSPDGGDNLAVGSTRQLVTRAVAAALSGVTTNNIVVSWVPYTESENISHTTFWDDPDAGQGNVWFIGELPSPVPVTDGEAAFFDVGDITFELEVYA